jgi:hypothetical protein
MLNSQFSIPSGENWELSINGFFFVLFVASRLVETVHQVPDNYGNQHHGYNNNAYSDP